MFNIDEIKKIIEDYTNRNSSELNNYNNRFSLELDDYYKNLQKQLEEPISVNLPVSIFQVPDKPKEEINLEQKKDKDRTSLRWLTPFSSKDHVKGFQNGGQNY